MNVDNHGPQSLRPEAAPARSVSQALVFSGSGSEYFRIWIVNLLLTLVTLGLYHPWAKVRRLRYFYGNTSLDGHALDFHGNPKKMLRGMLLIALLLGLYSAAGHFSPTAGFIAFLIVAAVWPALFRASMRFRLANTSWRGMRFRFTGSVGESYRSMLPLFVPGLSILAITAMAGVRDADDPQRVAPGIGMAFGLATLASVAIVPLLMWMLKKYQHSHYAIGQVATEFRTGPGSFYWLALKCFGVFLLTCAVCFGGLAASVGGTLFALKARGMDPGDMGKFIFLITATVLIAYAAVLLITQPFLVSRTQNLVWNATQGPLIRFESKLRLWPLAGLILKNVLLFVITFGLYWPFAKVAITRMRVQAMSVHLGMSADELAGSLHDGDNDATGDAAGDLFGIDIGW